MSLETRRTYRLLTAKNAKNKNISESALAKKYINSTSEKHFGYFIFSEKETALDFKTYLTLLISIPIIASFIIALLFKNAWAFVAVILPIWEITKYFIDLYSSKKSEYIPLPKMNLKQIPRDLHTTATVSMLLASAKDASSLSKKLEELYYSNRTDNLDFLALCDLTPASLALMPNDKEIINSAEKEVENLNKKYGERFHLIIRKRTENYKQFQGHERKRGAVEMLVRAIHGDISLTDFTLSYVGDMRSLQRSKYIIMLDSDTETTMDSIVSLCAYAAHPLNAPVISNGQVTSGYGIIAPSMQVRLKSSFATKFSRVMTAIGGISYNNSAASMFQDNFNESTFSGKGLIDTEAYFKLCTNRFRENIILSHDIIEGGILRTAYAGEVIFTESFPSTVMSWFRRLHRWLRGDIQNAPFIFKNVKMKNGIEKNPLSVPTRYCVFDNIRRAVTPVVSLLLLLSAFLVRSEIAVLFTLVVLISLLIPYIVGSILTLKDKGISSVKRKYFSGAIAIPCALLMQGFFSLMMFMQLAVISADALLRCTWRVLFRHDKLLEWTTASATESSSNSQIRYFAIAEILSILLIFTPFTITKILGLIFSFLPLFIISQNKAYSQPKDEIPVEKAAELSSQVMDMWKFYDEYVTEKDNFLPPDNVQFTPVFRVCRRTSPTNIGMYLLSVLTARDFEIINSEQLQVRISNTISSVEKMQKYHGNLYNRYDTDTLKLSANPFVSSVDSGNFVACLIALKEGLSEFLEEEPALAGIIFRIENLLSNTNLNIFYNSKKKLFSVGINPAQNTRSDSHYDYFMSEARMFSYLAIARREAPKEHSVCS